MSPQSWPRLADLQLITRDHVSTTSPPTLPLDRSIRRLPKLHQEGVWSVQDLVDILLRNIQPSTMWVPTPSSPKSVPQDTLTFARRAFDLPSCGLLWRYRDDLKKKNKGQGSLAEISSTISKPLTFAAPLEPARTHYPSLAPLSPDPVQEQLSPLCCSQRKVLQSICYLRVVGDFRIN